MISPPGSSQVQRWLDVLLVYYWAILYFVTYETEFGKYSLLGLAFKVPALLFVLANSEPLLRSFRKVEHRPLVLFIALVTAVSLVRLDLSTIMTLAFLTFTLMIILGSGAVVRLDLLNKLFLASIGMSIVTYHLGWNMFGYIPGMGRVADFGREDLAVRISLFPMVLESGLLSLFVILANYYFAPRSRMRTAMIVLGAYFMFFSGVRTALVIFAFVALFELLSRRVAFGRKPVYVAYHLASVAVFLLLYNADVILALATSISSDTLSTLFLRTGQEGMDLETGVQSSLFRTWLWARHLEAFLQHPLIGRGTFEFEQIIPDARIIDLAKSVGSESFLTGLLARVGLMAMPFFYFFHRVRARAMEEGDRFNFAITLVLLLSLLTYGNYFVPYNLVALLFFGSLNMKSVYPVKP